MSLACCWIIWGPDYDSPIRQAAVRLLTRAELNEAQLMEVAKNQVPNADLFLVPSLVEVFQGSENEAVGKALVSSLGSSVDRLDNFSERDQQKLLAGFPTTVQTAAESLLATLKERHAARLSNCRNWNPPSGKGTLRRGVRCFSAKGPALHVTR